MDARVRAASISAQRRAAIAFRVRDGEFVQRVGTELPELEFVDFTGEADPEAACRRWIDEASEQVLPLDGPLTRAAVLVDRTDSFLVYAASTTPWVTGGASIWR